MASIDIIGAGAVGSYYGALLARDGHDVTLVTRGAHLSEIRRSGQVTVREPGSDADWSVTVRAAARPDRSPDLVIVATKSHDTLAVAEAVARVAGGDVPVLSLQNGVENVARLESVLGRGRVLGATAFVGVWRDVAGEVVHGAEGLVTMGDPHAAGSDLLERVAALVGPSWDLALTQDLSHTLWRKLLWNVGFNPICAATGASAGTAVSEHPGIVRGAMEEARACAVAQGIPLTEADVDDMATNRPSLRGYLPSTARDALSGRRLERDALCGFVAREGQRLGVPTPINATLDAVLALQERRGGS